jgi:hypothetical protein
VARHRFRPCTFTTRAPAEACLGIRSVYPATPSRPPIQIVPPAAFSRSRRLSRPPSQANRNFFPRATATIPLTTPFFSSPPRTPLAPPSKPHPPPPHSPFCVTNYNRGFLRPMQPATQCIAKFHRTKQRNSDSRSTVQGLTIALKITKQRTKLFLTYGNQRFRIFNPHPTQPLPALRSSVENHEKINRKPELIEPLVSHSKQRIATQINRHTSQGPSFSFSLFTFPFSFCYLAPQSSFTSHCISNRKPEILGPHLSPALSINHPVLIANFEPSESPPFSPHISPPHPKTQHPAFPITNFPRVRLSHFLFSLFYFPIAPVQHSRSQKSTRYSFSTPSARSGPKFPLFVYRK